MAANLMTDFASEQLGIDAMSRFDDLDNIRKKKKIFQDQGNPTGGLMSAYQFMSGPKQPVGGMSLGTGKMNVTTGLQAYK